MVLGLIVAAVVAVLDQIAKWWVLAAVMDPPRVIPVTGFFNLVLAWNRGVSFGMFNEEGVFSRFALPVLTIAIIVALLFWMRTADRPRVAVAIGLIVGGAIGNLVDRLVFGAVVDFLDVHVAGVHWPAFNVADSGITVGATLLVLDALFGPSEKHKIR
jgi:signal peptidase II